MSTALQGTPTMRTEFSELYTLDSPTSHGTLYKEEAIIGNGAYGTVYKAREVNNPSNYVALKKVRIPLSEDGVPVSVLREIALIRQLDKYQHPNVVRFLDVCNGPRQGDGFTLFLVFEFVDKDLAKYIQTAPVEELTTHKIRDIAFQILCGIDFLHSQRILHRDIKPQNLLITRDGQVKLADFGLAKVYDFTMRLTSVVVTLWYRSPEVLLGSSYASPVDLWSVGCIFAELFRRRPLFPGTSERDQLEKIFDVLGSAKEEDWPCDARILSKSFGIRPQRSWESLIPGIEPIGEDLLTGLLNFNAEKRLSAKEALRHPYFEGLTEPVVEIRERVIDPNVAALNKYVLPSPVPVPLPTPTHTLSSTPTVTLSSTPKVTLSSTPTVTVKEKDAVSPKTVMKDPPVTTIVVTATTTISSSTITPTTTAMTIN